MPFYTEKTLRAPSTSSASAITFDTWTQENADRPVLITCLVRMDPGATNAAEIDIDVDESGGTTADYTFPFSAAGGLSGTREAHITLFLPAGAQWQIRNTSDPDGGNTIDTARVFVL